MILKYSSTGVGCIQLTQHSFHLRIRKKREISYPPELLSVSENELCSVEVVPK
jgi:hypothetical protein